MPADDGGYSLVCESFCIGRRALGEDSCERVRYLSDEFQRVGAEKYKEALSLLLEAWKGDPDSLRAETVTAMCRFVELYDGEYDRKRLIQRFRKFDPITIFRDGRSITSHMAGYKRYLHAAWDLYNGSSVKAALPMKF